MALSEHLEKLRYFNKVCSSPSIQVAAKSIGISQAGLSKSIQSLEVALGVQLFIRTNEGTALTESGRILFESSQKILNETINAETLLKLTITETLPQIVRFGMYDSIAVYFYAELSEHLSRAYPSVQLELTIEGSKVLREKVEAGDLDLAVGVQLENTNEKIKYYSLWEDHYAFYVSTELEKQIEDLPLIYFPEATDEFGRSCVEYLNSYPMKSKVQAKNFETIKSLVLSSLGCGVLPTQVARPLVKDCRLKQVCLPKIKQIFGKHSIGLVARKEFIKDHKNFVKDLHQLGISWGKF